MILLLKDILVKLVKSPEQKQATVACNLAFSIYPIQCNLSSATLRNFKFIKKQHYNR